MIVKTFSGPSLRDALANVREAFGEDAVILDTRFDASAGGRLDSRDRRVHVTAAHEPNPKDQRLAEGPKSLTLKGSLSDVNDVPVVAADPAEGDGQESDETPATPASAPEASEALDDPTPQVARVDGITGFQANPLELIGWLARQPQLANEVVDAYAAHIAESLPPFGPFLEREKSPLRVLFVGARGAGRSNAMFKACATRWRQRQAQPNLLIVSDNANHTHEQLDSVCHGCGLTLRTQPGGKGRFSLDRELKQADLFVEFVPGQTHSDLSVPARSVRKSVRPDVVALVISATDAPSHWVRVIERFAAFAPTHVIVTHWDEHQPWTEIASLAKSHNLSLAYRICGSDLFDEIDPFTESDIRTGVSDHLAIGLADVNISHKQGGRRDQS